VPDIPNPPRVAIYCRVSTGGQSTEQQVEACRRYCDGRSWEVAATIAEVQSTKKRRPKKEALLKALRRREYDGLVLFRLDRWARSAIEMLTEIEDLTSRGVMVVSLHETFDTTTAMGRAMLQLAAVFAQLERDLHAEATRERLAALKRMGKRLGHQSPIRGEILVQAHELRLAGHSLRQIARSLGSSPAAVHRALSRCPLPEKVEQPPIKRFTEPQSASVEQGDGPKGQVRPQVESADKDVEQGSDNSGGGI